MAKIKVLDNDKADMHDKYRIASSCDLKLFLSEPIDVKCPVTDNIITMSGVVPVEIKTDGYNKGEPHKDFEAQLRHQMICLDAQFGIITKLGPNLEMNMYPYERDEEWDADYLELVDDFWRRVEEDDPYPMANDNNYIADLNTLDKADELQYATEQLMHFKAQKMNFDRQYEEIENTIKDVLRKMECDQGIIGPYTLKLAKIQRKATPERVVPAKPAGEPYERLTIKINKEETVQ